MRIFDKTVQLNEEMQPVMLVTIELPLVLSEEFGNAFTAFSVQAPTGTVDSSQYQRAHSRSMRKA